MERRPITKFFWGEYLVTNPLNIENLLKQVSRLNAARLFIVIKQCKNRSGNRKWVPGRCSRQSLGECDQLPG